MTQILYFAQKAFIVHEHQLLLVQKSAEDPHNPGLWEVPGGRMEFGEDVDDHLRREVKEEVGLDVLPGAPFYVWQWKLSRDASEVVQIVAVARLCRAITTRIDVSNRVEDDFLGEVRWVALPELGSLSFIPNMIPVLNAFSVVTKERELG